ncbi:MAG: hypothetical protein K6E40_17350 [Desulfovibrio sp.]|nr:hypothetical protein [Desulfovibrio sp.]
MIFNIPMILKPLDNLPFPAFLRPDNSIKILLVGSQHSAQTISIEHGAFPLLPGQKLVPEFGIQMPFRA